MEQYGIGQPVRRKEDQRFLTGTGCYVDDLRPEGLTHLVFVRSPHAHARILSVDVSEALGVPGVLAVLTGEDWAADGLGPIPTRTPAKNSSGAPVPTPDRPGLVADRVRFVGDAVAAVIAETRDAAREGAEQVLVDYEELPAVVSAASALAPGAPLVWDEHPGNVCVDYENGDREAVERAFAEAAHIVALEVDNNRVTAAPIEPRGALGTYDAGFDHYTLVCATQNIHANRKQLAETVFHADPSRIRHLAHDVGGGFGTKNALYPEHAVTLWAARRVGRPVKWINDRSESFTSDSHGRDQQSRVELALDADGRFLALRVESVGPVGPYLLSTGPFTCTGGSARTQGGPYRIPASYFRGRAVFTNTSPMEPYRGAGRPEATYQVERVVEAAAAELDIDPLEIRRRNLLGREDLPWTTAAGARIDSGDFSAILERAVELSDWAGFPARADSARARGRLRGIGLCIYLECSGGGPKEYARLAFEADGTGTLAVGSQSTGMGHETSLCQLVAGRLGIDIERLRYVQADTDATPIGGGHGGSRGMEMGGSATLGAVEVVVERARQIAAHLLEAAPADLEFSPGRFAVAGTDRSVSIDDVLGAAFDPARLPAGLEPGLEGHHEHERVAVTYPSGCHVAEVEVDPDTGVVRLVDYTVVDDFGTIVNPLTAEGQVHGGTVQGIGQALLEHVVYDAESGQLLTGSFMDYCLPRADDLPMFRNDFYEGAPTANNPLGAKGSGEAGCCGALPAVVNAVVNALREHGVRHIDMPLTPERVWRALRR